MSGSARAASAETPGPVACHVVDVLEADDDDVAAMSASCNVGVVIGDPGEDAHEQTGKRRLVVVSITRSDTTADGSANVVEDRSPRTGPIPVHVLSAEQFQKLVRQLVEWGRQSGVSYVLKMRTQVVSASAVGSAGSESLAAAAPRA